MALLTAGVGASIPPQGVDSLAGNMVGLNGYPEVQVYSFSRIPRRVRDRVRRHLVARLGGAFTRRLRFTRGEIFDPPAIHKADPDVPPLQIIPTYILHFEFSDPSKGVAHFFASMWLTKSGKVLHEINLPSLRRHPERARLLPLADAVRVATKHGFVPEKASACIAYSPRLDCFFWEFQQVTSDDGSNIMTHCLVVDAHDGRVLDTYDQPSSR